MGKDPRVDRYISRAAPFARPILTHLRAVVHAGCPKVEETLKWGMPSFVHKGILCGMGAFKNHCVFGFWKEALLDRSVEGPAAGIRDRAMGQFGRLTSLRDLPDRRILLAYVRQAAALNDLGVTVPRRRRPRGKRVLKLPAFFMTAVQKNRKSLATFESFSYTHKKDYVDWVSEAKGQETRRRRLATAVAWMAEGKSRNWKYER